MKIGIYYNNTQTDRSLAENLACAVRRKHCETVIFSDIQSIGEVDRLIVLGGDGTVLRAARRASKLSIPLFGVNYGRLGFLTEFEREETMLAAELAAQEDCALLQRSMLEVDLNGTITTCLNEVSLLRGIAQDRDNKAVKFTVTIDGSRAGDFTADGLIVTTPTGSTAYSLSAGGSIMTPECETFQLTPVCSSSMRSRPIAYPDKSVLRFTLPDEKIYLHGDGIFLGTAGHDDALTVRKSLRKATFLTRSKNEYFRRLTEKIN